MPDTTDALNYDTAAQLVFQQAFAPAYFQKLAANGIVPADEAQAQRLLALADKIGYLDAQETNKVANAGTGLLDYANQVLDSHLEAAPVYMEPGISKFASELVKDARIRDAALLYQDAMNQLG